MKGPVARMKLRLEEQNMGQILQFPGRKRLPGRAENLSNLLHALSCQRHRQEDVYWLKENAELLNVLECTRLVPHAAEGDASDRQGSQTRDLAEISPVALAPLRAFYQTTDRHLCFFRQYYRFILSMAMDLEDLGLVDPAPAGEAGRAEILADWVVQQDLPGHELSDLQRAEARRLLARRGIAADFPGLDARLHQFMDNAAQFAVPNRKAAYELTHIVFYLSDYGRRDPAVSRAAIQSLTHVGLLAFLDQDADLLSEICIALRYCQRHPPQTWEDWLFRQHHSFAIVDAEEATAPGLHHDGYHMFLVSSWYQELSTGSGFDRRIPAAALRFRRPDGAGILHQLSEATFRAGAQGGDWQAMRAQVAAGLSDSGYEILCAAEGSSASFDSFFVDFARYGTVGPLLARMETA